MHGSLSSAWDWWDEWKLRILVLCSLFVQLFLLFSGYVRNWYILRWLRVVVWIAYIGGDALAIYALATLFNRQKQQTTLDGGGNTLEVIWAPVLLIHLGGQSITAYSLEDNELWKRHAITLVSQVTVALYVFCKWWSGEKRLLQAAVLLFIVGIIRFCEKPWALRRASFRDAASTNLSPPGKITSGAAAWRFLCCTNFRELIGFGEENKYQEASYSLKEYVEKAQVCVKEGSKASDSDQFKELQNNKIVAVNYIYRTFLDLPAPYSARLHYLQSFLKFDQVYGHKMLREWIGMQFSTLYTKVRSANTCIGFCLLFLLPSLALASVVLFNKSSKDGYNKSDITVTRILFAATAVIEFSPFWFPYLCLFVFRCKCDAINQADMVYSWQDMVSQHNIMLFCAQKKKGEPSSLMKIPGFSYLMDYINKHWCIWHEPAAQQISVLVRQHAEDGWKAYIRGPATHRRFNNLRGEQILWKHGLMGQLGWSFGLPFDECVLVWHVATDLCSRCTTNTSSLQGADIIPSRHNSEIISNHMIYLLFVCPDMLMVGTRQDLFMIACGEIELMIKDELLSSLDEAGSIARRILGVERGDDLMKNAPMISNARKLAEALICLDDEGKMWEVIQGVWVEMLCYSASRCRGYEHAKSLAHGGEFLTNVWLLWSCMGMETLPDKIHNPGIPGPLESDPDEEHAPAAAAAAAAALG